MKIIHRLVYFVVVYGVLLAASKVAAGAAAAPHFRIPGNLHEGSNETLPLKSSAAKVNIVGTIARVQLTQTYGNVGASPVEAIYVFPASTRAAVHGMTLTTGGQTIAARIRESVKAKSEYTMAKNEKKTAALLEEHRPNVFQMSVANLMPGDNIDVKIEWTETIAAVDGIYEFVFPTVVGPRYTGNSDVADPSIQALANPYLKADANLPTSFQLMAELTTTLPLAEVTCPSHPVSVDFKSKDGAQVMIDHSVGNELADRDFILRWKLKNDQVDAGLLLHRGKSLNHFLLQIAPPRRVRLEQIPPRDYVMVLDVSGSMNGFPLDTAKELLRGLVNDLRADDTFNVVRFASDSGALSETPMAANEGNIALALKFIDQQTSQGGTELSAALKQAMALPGGENRSRSLLLITDGYVSSESESAEIVRENIGTANLFTFGIGSSVNRELLERVSRAGGGEPMVVTTSHEATAAAKEFRALVSSPVLTNIEITADGVVLDGVEPESHPDVFAARPLIVTGTWQGEPRGNVRVRGIGGNGQTFEKIIDLAEAAEGKGMNHPELPTLWARERVKHLLDKPLEANVVQEIIRLGLNYQLLTPYTSFLAIDETTRNFAASSTTVKHPIPLPKGVSKSAFQMASSNVVKNGSVPEPGSVGLIAFLVVLLALQRQRDFTK